MRFLRFATALGFAAWLAKNDGSYCGEVGENRRLRRRFSPNSL